MDENDILRVRFKALQKENEQLKRKLSEVNKVLNLLIKFINKTNRE